VFGECKRRPARNRVKQAGNAVPLSYGVEWLTNLTREKDRRRFGPTCS